MGIRGFEKQKSPLWVKSKLFFDRYPGIDADNPHRIKFKKFSR